MPAARAGDGAPKGGTEIWAGGDAFSHAWSLYSGVGFAPFGGIQEDGLRLRAVGGYGTYRYAGERWTGVSAEHVKFRGTASFADLLIGYHKQLGPLTLKVFAGATLAGHQITPGDPENVIQGSEVGGKAVFEAWWNITDAVWSSVDLSWSTLWDDYGARLRLGRRFGPALSAGLEVGAVGNIGYDNGRIGGFMRYEWEGGEVSFSGGVVSEGLTGDALSSTGPFATLSWMTRF